MRNSALTFRKTLGRGEPSTSVRAALPAHDLERYLRGWLLDGEIRQHSPKTITLRRQVLCNLAWFLAREGLDKIGTPELRQFLVYLSTGHKDPGGRWGNLQQKSTTPF